MALHNPQAISLDDLKNIGPVPRTTGKQHLEALLNIIKAAITQVHMMSGVGVLQQIQDDLFSPESERQIRAGNALINNPQLQKNILFASIQNQMNITGTNINAYAQVYKSNNPLVITELLTGPQWNVVKDENGLWKAKLDLTIQGYTASSEPQKQVIEIYLPNSAQMESKQLSHQPELKFLMETKDLIINEIMQYEIWSDKEDWFKKLYLDAI